MSRTYKPGDLIRVAGIYVAGKRRIALSIGERAPGTREAGWRLEQRIAVERPGLMPPIHAAPPEKPIVIDAVAMEYAIEASFNGGWNGALRALEARLLANGADRREEALAYIAELRIARGKMPRKEGDRSDG